jgi:hypothetical protein
LREESGGEAGARGGGGNEGRLMIRRTSGRHTEGGHGGDTRSREWRRRSREWARTVEIDQRLVLNK